MASLGITCSPVRNIMDQKILSFRPFGGLTATDVLQHYLGTPEIISNVLFLGCGDLRNALFTATRLTEAFYELNVHVSDEIEFIVARNFLISYIMLDVDFKPSEPCNVQYLWDIWYGYQWNETTRKRFVKDLKTIISHRRWNNPALVLPQPKAFEHLKSIFKLWLGTACNMPPAKIKEALNKRISSMRHAAFMDTMANQFWLRFPLEQDATDAQTIDVIKKRICIKTFYGNLPPSSIDKEVENLVKTGNCMPITEPIVCLNPTFLVSTDWQPFYLSCPYDAYFPVPVDEQLASTDNGFVTTSAYRYCQSKLESLVDKLQENKHRVRLYFYFGECIELCRGEKKLINKCEVVHCSDLADKTGLANLILAATNCLSNGNLDSVLLTETSLWRVLVGMQRLNTDLALNETMADYVQMSLRCPLSLVPTLYGLRLTNHANLGSPLCVQRHDSISTSRLTLRWLRTFGFSNNVKVDISSELITAIDRFMEPSFLIKAKNRPPPGIPEMPNTPLSFYYFLFALADRLKWSKEVIEPLFQQITVPVDYQLEWRTQQSWMLGQPVLMYSLENSGFLRDAFLSTSDVCYIQLLLVSPRHMKRYGAQFFKQLPVEFFTGVTCIENISWSRSRKDFLFDTADAFRDPQKQILSFILAKNHGFDSKTQLCFVCMTDLKLIGTVEVFAHCTVKEIVNPTPLCCSSAISDISSKCSEFDNRYEMDMTIAGARINDIKDIVLSTDQTHPSWSAHQITLTMGNAVTVQVPWPVLAKGIELSLVKGKKRNSVHLVMMKSLADPWPIEFGGRSKWDPDRLKHWKDLTSNGDIKMHVDAQFSCDLLSLDKRLVCISNPPQIYTVSKTALDEVREIIRAIFYGHYRLSFNLFAIYDHLQSDEPVFHLRVQPPFRITPQGSPLLLISVIDHQLARQLIANGNLDSEENQFEFHRLITERVSRPVCDIRASSMEEIDMFRYVLRLNSTRMRRGVWQSKNLPRGETSPWLPTFLSPLYVETIQDDCVNMLCLNFKKLKSLDPPGTEKKKLPACSTCFVKKIQLRTCTGCKIVTYCSVACQKANWTRHKLICGLRDVLC